MDTYFPSNNQRLFFQIPSPPSCRRVMFTAVRCTAAVCEKCGSFDYRHLPHYKHAANRFVFEFCRVFSQKVSSAIQKTIRTYSRLPTQQIVPQTATNALRHQTFSADSNFEYSESLRGQRYVIPLASSYRCVVAGLELGYGNAKEF